MPGARFQYNQKVNNGLGPILKETVIETQIAVRIRTSDCPRCIEKQQFWLRQNLKKKKKKETRLSETTPVTQVQKVDD